MYCYILEYSIIVESNNNNINKADNPIDSLSMHNATIYDVGNQLGLETGQKNKDSTISW